jgi:hypothetical protein
MRRLWDESERNFAATSVLGTMRGRTATVDQFLAFCIPRNENVIFVDWIHVTNMPQPGDLVMAVYINGCLETFLQTGLTIAQVEKWVKNTLDSAIRDPLEAERFLPSEGRWDTEGLFEMNDLLK